MNQVNVKKWMLLFLVSFIFLTGVTPASAEAAGSKKRYVKGNVELYSKSTHSGIAVIDQNEKVTLLSKKADKNGYYKVSYKGLNGYIASSFLSHTKNAYLYVAESMNVYSRDGENGELLGMVQSGERVGMISEKKTAHGCYRIIYGNQVGYVRADSQCVYLIPSEKKVYKSIIKYRKRYPEGMNWTNAKFYEWNGLSPEYNYYGGYGCAAFAFKLSDAAFGDVPCRKHTEFNKVHAGDILRINDNTHSVIVLQVKGNKIVIAEGNYNSSVHWGRVITKRELRLIGDYVITRYY